MHDEDRECTGSGSRAQLDVSGLHDDVRSTEYLQAAGLPARFACIFPCDGEQLSHVSCLEQQDCNANSAQAASEQKTTRCHCIAKHQQQRHPSRDAASGTFE